MGLLHKFDQWHKSRQGYAVMGVLELAAAYGLGSRALSTGSWWEYGLTLLLLIGGVQNLIQLIRKK